MTNEATLGVCVSRTSLAKARDLPGNTNPLVLLHSSQVSMMDSLYYGVTKVPMTVLYYVVTKVPTCVLHYVETRFGSRKFENSQNPEYI